MYFVPSRCYKETFAPWPNSGGQDIVQVDKGSWFLCTTDGFGTLFLKCLACIVCCYSSLQFIWQFYLLSTEWVGDSENWHWWFSYLYLHDVALHWLWNSASQSCCNQKYLQTSISWTLLWLFELLPFLLLLVGLSSLAFCTCINLVWTLVQWRI